MKSTSPLIMIHGLLGSINYFSPATYLDGITVHTPDLLGYGANRSCVETLTLELQAQHVVQYIRTQVGCPGYILGHSVGGAIAMMVAKLAPELIKGVISVEGNFTLNDAFWCRKIAPMKDKAWSEEYEKLQADPQTWLVNSGIRPTGERITWARNILENQPYTTVQAMARAVLRETGSNRLLDSVRAILHKELPVYLIAGEKSNDDWNVPDWVRMSAKDSVILSGVGHLMMLEEPEQFCLALRDIIYDRTTLSQKIKSFR